MPEMDFDLTESDLQIGLEVEYPLAESFDDKMIGRGQDSDRIRSQFSPWPGHIGGDNVYDGTVGMEIVSRPLHPEDAVSWYADVIDYVEGEQYPYQPTGILDNGNTAGLHIHISDLREEEARELRDLSEEPWLQVLACTSIASSDGSPYIPVFRGGRYCDMSYNSGHYSVVNARNPGHYEWRLPEPMTPGNLEVLMRFLALFKEDSSLAVEYAQERLDDADDRITSLLRAENIGLDIDEQPIVVEEPSDADPENFYEELSGEWATPDMYRVTMDGHDFYTFETDYLFDEFEAPNGEYYSVDDVLYADSLEPVETRELRGRVRNALMRREEARRETEATEELKKVVKKKK